MEPIQHTSHLRRKRNTTKSNLVLSAVIHGIFFAAAGYWAAHEGVLGKKMQELSVLLVPKEKKDEPEQAEEQKTAEVKPAEQVKSRDSEPVRESRPVAPPPAKLNVPPAANIAAAPPPVVIPGFSIGTDTSGSDDVVHAYKNYVESELRARWERPADVDDRQFIAEVDVELGPDGRLIRYDWLKGSGHEKWDQSVRLSLDKGRQLNRPPPKGFPDKFLVRFDTVSSAEPLAMR